MPICISNDEDTKNKMNPGPPKHKRIDTPLLFQAVRRFDIH